MLFEFIVAFLVHFELLLELEVVHLNQASLLLLFQIILNAVQSFSMLGESERMLHSSEDVLLILLHCRIHF